LHYAAISRSIEYDKKLWLVPFWLDQQALRRLRPVRLIRLDSLLYEPDQSLLADFVLNETLPKFLFDPELSGTPEKKFEVVESPDIWFEYQSEEK
jgi:hypothetical protein